MLPFNLPDDASITHYLRKCIFKFLQNIGFVIVRINGSQHRLKHPDGRGTTVSVRKNQDLPKGLLRKIIREDLQLELNDFIELSKKLYGCIRQIKMAIP